MAQTHHYLFDTATGFNDSIGSTNFTAVIGSIGSVGKINQCLDWSYSGGSAAATTSSALFPATGAAFSIAFWLKTTTSTMTNGEFIKNTSTGFVIETTDSPSYFQIRYSSMSFFPEVFSPVSWFWNSFNHIVFTYDGSSGMGGTGTWKVYSNGSLITTTTVAGTPQTSGPYMIGSGWATTSSIDDLRIYDTVIDATEVAFIYNGGSGTQAVSSSGAGSASGTLSTVTMSGPAGSATGSGGGAGSASGALSTVTMSGPAGSASSGSPGSASGLLATITVSSFSGIGGVSVTGSGSLSTITVSSFTGIGFPEFIGTGPLGTVSVTAIEAVASISTSIQLSYCACDAEIGWQQSLPITGFVSAVQGEDAISARVTPVVSGIDANIVFFEQRTLTASSSYTYDLRSLTDFLGQSFSLSRAYAISVVMTSGSATISPGVSNPLKWFFNSNTANVTITSGNSFMFAQKGSAIVSNSAKTILMTNPSGLSACVYKIAILGGR
jgi:hypothetical protein